MFLHSDYGCQLFVKLFGTTINGIDSLQVATDHQIEDLGKVVSVDEWLTYFDSKHLRKQPKPFVKERLLEKYGQQVGTVIDFFDDLPSDNPLAKYITHNAWGIFLAEQVFGSVITLNNGSLISTRQIGEDLIVGRLGVIPTPSSIASRVTLNNMLVGNEVHTSLRIRKTGVRKGDDKQND